MGIPCQTLEHIDLETCNNQGQYIVSVIWEDASPDNQSSDVWVTCHNCLREYLNTLVGDEYKSILHLSVTQIEEEVQAWDRPTLN